MQSQTGVRRLTGGVAGLALVAVLAGCGGSDGDDKAAEVPSAPPVSVAPMVDAPSPSPSASASASPGASASSSANPSKSSADPKKSDSDDSGGDTPQEQADAVNPQKLNADAAAAYGKIKTAMATDGITLSLTSGKRSREHQQRLWDEEVRTTGSSPAARQRVLPPELSSHVKGNAIDIGPATAQTWLQKAGPAYGWCRLYDNESWHFEFKTGYKTAGCPARKPSP